MSTDLDSIQDDEDLATDNTTPSNILSGLIDFKSPNGDPLLASKVQEFRTAYNNLAQAWEQLREGMSPRHWWRFSVHRNDLITYLVEQYLQSLFVDLYEVECVRDQSLTEDLPAKYLDARRRVDLLFDTLREFNRVGWAVRSEGLARTCREESREDECAESEEFT